MRPDEVKVGIDGRVFHVDQPGGDASVGIKHGDLLLDSYDRSILYGHPELADESGNHNVSSTGFLSKNLIYGLLWQQSFLPVIATNDGIDVLYSPNSYCPVVPTPFQCVVAIQDIPSYHGFGSERYKRFRKTILPIVANRSDHIITVSEFTRNDISRHLQIDKSKISVVHNGIDDLFFNGDSVRPNFEVPEKYVLFVGAKSSRKNVEGVMKSYQLLKKMYGFDHDLVIVGPYDNSTYDILDIQGEDVLIPDYLEKPELKYIYEKASLFLYPSFHDSFGLPPLEAAACGTPVVTTRRGAIPEIMGDFAEFVDPQSPEDIARGASKVLSDKSYSGELVEGAMKRADQFRWSKQRKNLTAVIDRVATQK